MTGCFGARELLCDLLFNLSRQLKPDFLMMMYDLGRIRERKFGFAIASAAQKYAL